MSKKFFGTAHHEFPAAGYCHDCKVPSRTYRCPACKAAFIDKYCKTGGAMGAGMPSDTDTYSVEAKFVKSSLYGRHFRVV